VSIIFLPLCVASSLAHQQKLVDQLPQFSGGPSNNNKYGCCGRGREWRPLGFNLNNNPGSFSNEEYGGKDLEADVMFKSSSELAISAQSQLSETPAATLLPAILGDLRISGADLEPSFNATVFSYSAAMGEYVSFVKITPVLPPGHIVQVSQCSKIIQYLTHIPCAPFALMMMMTTTTTISSVLSSCAH
jgi:hypothetical protein